MVQWFKKKRPLALPANIHDANAEMIAKESQRWLEEIDAILGRIPGGTTAGTEEAFYASTDRVAQRTGKTRDELLKGYARRLRESNYPTPECLTPDEVQKFAEGIALTETAKDHVDSCSPCRALLSATSARRNIPTEVAIAARKEAAEAYLSALAARTEAPSPTLRQRLVDWMQRWLWAVSVPRKAIAAASVLVLLAIAAIFLLRPGPAAAPVRLAVLPVQKLEINPQAFGVTENLTRLLGIAKGLLVIGTESIKEFQKRDRRQTEIEGELGVETVAQLSTAEQGDKLLISAELIDISTNKLVWSDAIEGTRADGFKMQNDMARKIARAAGVKLTSDEKARLSTNPDVSSHSPSYVFQLYQEGRYDLGKRDLQKAVGEFSQVVEEAPKFALGWASLAESYNLMALRGEMPPSMSTADAYLKAKQSASEALRLDSNLANAHSALALNYLYNEFNWTEAKAEFGRAIELNASYADAHRWNGLLLSALHQPYEAIEELKLAFKLEPLSPSISTALGDGYFISRQYDKAIDQYEKTLEKNPEYGGAKRNLASAFVETKKYEQAVDLLQQTKDIKGDLLFKGELAYAYAVWGQQRKARKLLAKLDDPFEIAIVYAGLGDKSHALDSLRKAVDSHNSLLFHLPIHPAFDALRSQPDFQALLRRINYPNA